MAEELEAHRSFLWGLCYRLTGDAADADDLVQETFVRALARPPRRTDLPWRPWLVRVAVNLGRDALRRRRRRRYDGPWLPSPVETGDGGMPALGERADPAAGPGARYDLVESASYAFLVAAEALTPTQRAVLILRDVLDYSVREAAGALGLSSDNVKTTHLRARRALSAYDRDRRPTRDLREATGRALERFLTCLAAGDAAGLEALLAEGVRAVSDAGGEFAAARAPIVGRDRVLRLLLGLRAKLDPTVRVELRPLNGLPAAVALQPAVAAHPRAPRGWARRFALLLDVDEAGRVRGVYSVLASRKLAALRLG